MVERMAIELNEVERSKVLAAVDAVKAAERETGIGRDEMDRILSNRRTVDLPDTGFKR